MSSVSVQWFPVNPLLAPLLMVHSLCPQQMWHAVSTVPSKLAVELSPAWKTQLVTQMACMTSASPSYTVLLNLTLRYTLSFHFTVHNVPPFSLSLWAVWYYMGVTVRARMCEALLFLFCFYRVKHLWRRALSALQMALPRRHSLLSDAAPPSKEWYMKCKRSVTASWISAMWPDQIQMLLVKWHSYRVTSPIGELFLFCVCFPNMRWSAVHHVWGLFSGIVRRFMSEFKACDVKLALWPQGTFHLFYIF